MSNSWRVIVFLFFIAFFFALDLLGPSEAELAQVWKNVVYWLLFFVVGISILFVLYLRSYLGNVQAYTRAAGLVFKDQLNEGLAAMNGLDAGLKPTQYYPMLLQARGYTVFALGRLDEALSILGEAESVVKSRGMKKGDAPFIVYKTLAELWAVEGHTDIARRNLKVASQIEPQFCLYPLSLSELIILCREKSYAQAAELMTSEYRAASGLCPAHQVNVIKLFWAFALDGLKNPTEQTEIARLIAGLHPFKLGEFDYLAVNWPELKVFLKEQNLSAADAAA